MALVLLSKTYLAKYQHGVVTEDGNIWSEVNVLKRVQRMARSEVRFLTPDGYDSVKEFGDFPLLSWLVDHAMGSS